MTRARWQIDAVHLASPSATPLAAALARLSFPTQVSLSIVPKPSPSRILNTSNTSPETIRRQSSTPKLVGQLICSTSRHSASIRTHHCILPDPTSAARAYTRRSAGSVVYRLCIAASPLTRHTHYSHAHFAPVPRTGFQIYRMRLQLALRATRDGDAPP